MFDQYWETSIEGRERARRGSSSFLEIRINDSPTPIPKQWSKYIGNLQSKIKICDFLTSDLIGDDKPLGNILAQLSA